MDKRSFLGHCLALPLAALTGGCQRRQRAVRKASQRSSTFTRCVSTAVLQRRLLAECADGTCTADPLLTLAGLTRFNGFLIDKANKDLVLVGAVERESGKPVLNTADLVVALRSATHRYLDDQHRFSPPGVSLDPQPAVMRRLMQFDVSGLSGVKAEYALQAWRQICQSPQDVRVIGLAEEGSHYLSVIERADETMKSYVDGTLELSGLEVPSRIILATYEAELKQGREARLDLGASMSRYWFNAGPVRCAADEKTCLLLQCDVRLSTEAQMPSGNKLADSQKRDALADRCAESFTRLLPGLAAREPLYQELINIYRAQSLAIAMVRRNAFVQAGLVLAPLLDRWQAPIIPVPRQVPGRWAISGADFKQNVPEGYSIQTLRIPSCGGVSVNPQPSLLDFSRDRQFASRSRSALALRPDSRALFWDLDFSSR